MAQTNVYRDGKVHVMKRLCNTCIFREDGRAAVGADRVEQLARDAIASEGCIPCHHTTYGQDERGEAVCRGFFELRATVGLRLAEALKVIEWQEEV